MREHRGLQFPATWPAVFDIATWKRMQLKIKLSADRFAGRPKAQKYLLTGRTYCGKCASPLNGETKRDRPERPLRPIYHCRVRGDTQRDGGCGGVTVNATALNWYVRESVFDHINPEAVVELLRYDESGDGKLKQLLDQRAAQQFRLDGLVDDYASGLLDRAELSGSRQKPKLNYRVSMARSNFWLFTDARWNHLRSRSRCGKLGKLMRVPAGVER